MNKKNRFLATALLITAYSLPAWSGDPAKGANAFDEQCGECHSLKPGKHKKGPSLAGVFGRPAGSMDNFDYSNDLKSAKITWTADKLDAYIKNPKGTYPGIKMKFDGLPNDAVRSDLISFFESLR